MEQQAKEKHWSESMIIDWSDTYFRKHIHTVKIIDEGWFGDNYYITSPSVSSKEKRPNVTSTDGRIGSCVCDAFRTHPPTPLGKAPCKHLWVCRDRMLERIDKEREYNRKYQLLNKKDKDDKICENLRATKGDPNSLLLDERFVKKMMRGDDK